MNNSESITTNKINIFNHTRRDSVNLDRPVKKRETIENENGTDSDYIHNRTDTSKALTDS